MIEQRPRAAVPHDLREWIALLREAGELAVVEAEVDPKLEITEIVDRTIKAGGPALLFERPRGSELPLLINQFGTERRLCLAFAETSLDAIARKFDSLSQPPAGAGPEAHVRAAGRYRRLADSMPRVVANAPCQEIVLEPNLDLLPIQHCWPGDAAPFITLPAVITHDPATGVRNVGIYRMQKIDSRTTYMHWQIHKDGAADWRNSTRKLEVAVALGCDPVTTYTACAPLPRDIDELLVAGYLRGAPVDLVRATTIDVDVPADAEIVLEGYVDEEAIGLEGPFGDHMGYYTPPERFPVFHITAMTMRRDAIYPSTFVGLAPQEDAWLGKLSERISLPALRRALPEIVDYDLPVGGAFQHCAIVSLRKSYPGHARKVAYAIWGVGTLSLTKAVVVVDDFVDVHDYGAVFFHVCANVDPKRDIVIVEGPIDQLDHSAIASCFGGKIAIDATHKLPEEGGRPWPPRIEMSAQVRDRVDARWHELGLDLIAHEGDSTPRASLPF